MIQSLLSDVSAGLSPQFACVGSLRVLRLLPQSIDLDEKESVNTSSIRRMVLELSLLQLQASPWSFNLSMSALSVTSWLEDLNAAEMCISCCWSVVCGLIMQPDAAILLRLHSVILQAVDRWIVVDPPTSRQEGKHDFLYQQPGTFMVKVDSMHSYTEGSELA